MPIHITQKNKKILGCLAYREEDEKSNCTLVTQRRDSETNFVYNYTLLFEQEFDLHHLIGHKKTTSEDK